MFVLVCVLVFWISDIIREQQTEVQSVIEIAPANFRTEKEIREMFRMNPVSNSVSPETEAALNAVGLSATSMVKITVAAQSLPPVVVKANINKNVGSSDGSSNK
jgi:hypothetical protein